MERRDRYRAAIDHLKRELLQSAVDHLVAEGNDSISVREVASYWGAPSGTIGKDLKQLGVELPKEDTPKEHVQDNSSRSNTSWSDTDSEYETRSEDESDFIDDQFGSGTDVDKDGEPKGDQMGGGVTRGSEPLHGDSSCGLRSTHADDEEGFKDLDAFEIGEEDWTGSSTPIEEEEEDWEEDLGYIG